MDGFAVAAGPAGRALAVVGESRAGEPYAGVVGEGEAVRISTGAALPDGAAGILQIELVRELDGTVTLDEAVHAGRNVRGPGEDLRAGATVLERGTRLGPAELGVAVGAGRATLTCARRPRVAVLTTGDELREPGAPLAPGQIHNSNLTTLAALAEQAGADVRLQAKVPDTPEATRAAIDAALAGADLVVLSGGVSVGPHDHVKPALADLGVRRLLWRVALRPGKPTWMGERDGTLVLGLPGNPVSSYVTFVLFARPALAALQGAEPAPTVGRRRAPLAVAIARHPDRDECVRVALDDDGAAHPTGPQGSHVLSSMLRAEALAVVPRGDGELPAGTEVALEPL
jgi:molybdopterin molybdotransferase